MEDREIPQGNTPDEIAKRRHIIARFFHEWKEQNPDHCRFNNSLNENIYVRFVSEIGAIKITVGVKRRTHEKNLYCITAIEAI